MEIYLIIANDGIQAAFTDQAVAVKAAAATGDATAYVQRLWVTT